MLAYDSKGIHMLGGFLGGVQELGGFQKLGERSDRCQYGSDKRLGYDDDDRCFTLSYDPPLGSLYHRIARAIDAETSTIEISHLVEAR